MPGKKHARKEHIQGQTPGETRPPAPEPTRVPRATGLPEIGPNDRVLLRGNAQWLIHASGSDVCIYCLRRCGDDVEAELHRRLTLEGTVTALAESRYGVVIAYSREKHSTLLRLVEGHAHHVASVQGRISSVVCLGASAYAVVTKPQRLDAKLVEIDLYRQAIVSEQTIPSAKMELTSDVTGTYLGLLDPVNRTFQVRNPKSQDPCAPGTTGGGAPANQPPPGGVPSAGGDGGCGCRKTPTPQPSPGGTVPGSGQPGSGGQPPAGTSQQPCVPGDGGIPTPGGGSVVGHGGRVGQNPPGGAGPNPCSADLGWRARLLQAAASSFVVADATGRNLAVLAGRDMRILDSRQLGHLGAVVMTDPASPMVLLHHRSGKTWEVLHTDTLASRLGALERIPLVDPYADGIVFTGMQTMDLITHHANATGTVKVLVLPVLEAGQTFNDPDFANFGAYLERTAFSNIRAYYFENSFGLLKDIQYQIYGLETGPGGGPLHLPRLVKDYYYPPYDPARVELTKPAVAFPYSLVFDGRESLTLKVQGATGGRAAATLTLSFPALLVANTQQLYPAQVHYAGTETATINVKLPSGTAKTLKLAFPAKNIDINSDADVDAALADLANYLDGVFAAAESAAGIAPRLFTKPNVRRIKQAGMDFGVLVATWNHTDFSGARLDVTSVSTSGSDPLGFQSALPGHITLDGTAPADTVLQTYLQFVEVMAEEDAHFDFTQRYLADVSASSTGGNLLVKLSISDQDGGPGASVTLASSAELGALFDTATAVPNSDTTLDNSEAVRDLDALINDAFTDAVTRQAPPGSDYASLRDGINAYFNQFDSIMIGQVGQATNDPKDPATVQPSEMWTASAPNHGFLRAVEWWHTGQFAPYTDIQTQKPWNFLFFETKPDFPTMCHELGHALGYRDLYGAKDFRRDLAFLETWSIMDSQEPLAHHAAYHKWESGWIPPERVISIPPAPEKVTTETEALLVPVEYWDDSLVAKAQAQFAAPDLQVVQIIELDLGGDNAIVDRIEARQTGVLFSQKLPQSPAILITNALQPWDDTRYSSTDATTGDERYRRELQLLNPSDILQNPGDSFDLAKAPALPAKGIVATVVDRKEIDGISVFRIKVSRENTAYVDLYFTKGDPYYKSPDLWVDWAGDNGPGGGSSADPKDHRSYPPGQPTDQGEQVHVPDSGTELHWIVGRVRNKGQVEADEVKLNFQVCIPPGGGDKSKNFQTMSSETVPTVVGGDVPLEVPTRWDVPAGFGGHVCLLVDIADYTIPRDSDGSALASADVWPANNWAQKNVDQYVPVHNSPYAPTEFDFSVNNAGWHAETTYLEPENLPYGMHLTVTPARRSVPAGATVIFRCKLELDDQIIDAGCRNDREFRIVAWRTEGDTAVPWGGVVYKVKPRKGSVTTLTGFWAMDGTVQLNGSVSPDPGGDVVHIRLAFAGSAARWQVAPIQPGGAFTLTVKSPGTGTDLDSVALYEGSAMLGPSRSAPLKISAPARIN